MLLSTTYDHALTALLIQRADELGATADRPLGRTALQKLLFFLSMKGVPTGFKFTLFTYGPMCREVFETMDWLLADEAVEDSGRPDQGGSAYRPGPAAEDVIRQHAEALLPWESRVDEILEEFAPFDPSELELRATITFLNSQEQGSGRPGPYRAAVLERLNIVKREKIAQGRFTPERIATAYTQLLEKGWIAP